MADSPTQTQSSSVPPQRKPSVTTAATRPPQLVHQKQVSEETRRPSTRQQSTSAAHHTEALEETLRNFRLLEAMRAGDTAALALALQSTTVPVNAPTLSLGTPHGSQPGSPLSPVAPSVVTTGTLVTSGGGPSGVMVMVPSPSGTPGGSGSGILSSSVLPPPQGTATPLHLAAAFASLQVIQFLLKPPYKFPINAFDAHGNTALHLAARAGRATVVSLLLAHNADDTLSNAEGKDCRDIAKTEEIRELFDASRRLYAEEKTAEMHRLGAAGNLLGLQQLFSDHRTAQLVDINAAEPYNGDALLHQAAELNHLEMVQWCLKMKADPLVRDKRGKLAMEKTKNDKIKQLLKDGLANAPFPTSPTNNSSVKMQGILYKWTNYAGGYKKRWFVLEDGILSYYRDQEDVPVSCRGSISLKVAKLWIDSSDRNRFDIVGRGNVRYHLKADHPAETKRWVIALTEAKQWLQDHTEFEKTKKEKSRLDVPLSQAEGKLRKGSAGTAPGEVEVEAGDAVSVASANSRRKANSVLLGDDEDDDEESAGDAPYNETFNATMNSALACVQYQEQLMTAVSKLVDHKQAQLLETYKKASQSLTSTLHDLVRMAEERETYWQKRMSREEELKRVWDENLRELAMEHDALQEQAAEQVSMLESQAKLSYLSLNRNGGLSGGDAVSGGDGIAREDGDDEEEFFDAIGEYEAHNPRLSDATALKEAAEGAVVSLTDSVKGYPPSNAVQLRKLLPLAEHPTAIRVEISLWSVLKNNIGKDLSKIALPVYFNEPLSMLQRFCEEMEYSTLLDIAARQENSLHRIQFVAAFAQSNYSSTLGRVSKPFNPLLGETYELVRKDRGFRYIAEQVSHHPPITACYCESDEYVFWAEVNVKNKFWGKSLEIIPQGVAHLILKRTKEHYSWRKVTTCVNNVIVGKLWIDHYGDMVITNHATDETCLVRFKQAGWRGKGQFELEGHVADKSGAKKFELFGHWNDRLLSRPLQGAPPISADALFSGSSFASNSAAADGSLSASGHSTASPSSANASTTVLWKRNPTPADSEKMFNFTEFAATLNEMTPELKDWVCRTDSRLRPDQRFMEEGNFDLADREKIRLEEQQRAVRKQRNEEGNEWQPTWFYRGLESDTGEEHWAFKGGYWEARAKKNWPEQVPNIF